MDYDRLLKLLWFIALMFAIMGFIQLHSASLSLADFPKKSYLMLSALAVTIIPYIIVCIIQKLIGK